MEQEPIFEAEPYNKLISAGEEALLRLFPELSGKKDLHGLRKIVDVFVGDVLSAKEIPGGVVFHRFDIEKQKKLLEDVDINDLFGNLSDDLVNFYRDKINSLT